MLWFLRWVKSNKYLVSKMDLYKEEVMDQYEHPRNMGALEGDDVVFDQDENASCGDSIKFYLRIAKSSDHSPKSAQGSELIITEVRWSGVGCAISLAAASKLSEYLQGRTLQEIKDMAHEELVEKGIGFEVNPGRMKCLMLPIKLVKKILGS